MKIVRLEVRRNDVKYTLIDAEYEPTPERVDMVMEEIETTKRSIIALLIGEAIDIVADDQKW